MYYIWPQGEEIVRYDFSDRDYWGTGLLGACRLKQVNVNCNVPAGKFSDCINFQFLAAECGDDAYQFGEYLAPNVGNVKYVVLGGKDLLGHQEGDFVTFQLKNYKIVK